MALLQFLFEEEFQPFEGIPSNDQLLQRRKGKDHRMNWEEWELLLFLSESVRDRKMRIEEETHMRIHAESRLISTLFSILRSCESIWDNSFISWIGIGCMKGDDSLSCLHWSRKSYVVTELNEDITYLLLIISVNSGEWTSNTTSQTWSNWGADGFVPCTLTVNLPISDRRGLPWSNAYRDYFSLILIHISNNHDYYQISLTWMAIS